MQWLRSAAYRGTWGGPTRMPDLTGRVFLVTGGSSGLGFEVCKQLAAHKATVVMAGRNEEKSKEAIEAIRRQEGPNCGAIEFLPLELSSLRSVRRCAEAFLARGLPLHCLVCNAGLGLPQEPHTEDGFETTVGVNFYGHLYLLHLLLDHLKRSAPSRLVIMSSPEESRGFIPWDDMAGKNVDKSDFNWYGSANLWKLMVAQEVAERLKGTGVSVFAVHPGMSKTEFFPKMDYSQTESTLHNKMQQAGGQSAATGATSTLFAATEPGLEGESGAFYGPYYFAAPMKLFGRGSWQFPFTLNMFQCMSLYPSNHLARDPDTRRRLYEAAVDALEDKLKEPLPGRLAAAPPLAQAAT